MAKKKKKKTPKRRKKSGKLKGNYRLPTLAAAKRYLKQHKKFSSDKKSKSAVKIRFDEARSILRKATRAGRKVGKLSKKKGRGNFKITTPAKSRAYIKRVASQQPAVKLRKAPFAYRVRECVHHLGKDTVNALIAAGQKTLARAQKRKDDAEAKKKNIRKKRLKAQAKKLLAEAKKIEKSIEACRTRNAAKLKAAKTKYNAARRKASAARKKRKRSRK
jgi:hypothetical protein